ncbi:MAG: hypothetical protein WD648_02745 [Planctomycetaceae bacterium]
MPRPFDIEVVPKAGPTKSPRNPFKRRKILHRFVAAPGINPSER